MGVRIRPRVRSCLTILERATLTHQLRTHDSRRHHRAPADTALAKWEAHLMATSRCTRSVQILDLDEDLDEEGSDLAVFGP